MNKKLVQLLDRGMIEGVIFDMDGVLLDSMPVWEHAGELFLQSRGKKPRIGLRRALLYRNMEQGAEYMKEAYGLEESIPAIIDGIDETIRQHYEQSIPLKPGVKDFLHSLQQRQIPRVIATTSDRELAVAALQRLGILSCFQEIFTCGELHTYKAEPLIYEKAHESLGTVKTGTWVFEDSLMGAATAHQAGYPVVGVKDPSSRGQERNLRIVCDCYINKW